MTTATSKDLASHLARQAAERPDAVATVLPSGPRYRRGPGAYRQMSLAELDARSDEMAAGLARMGIARGARTALLVPPCEDFFALAFALLKTGAVPVLVDPGIGLANIKRCLGQMEPVAFIGVPRAHLARRLLSWCPRASTLVTVGHRIPGGGSTLRSVRRVGKASGPFTPTPQLDSVAAIAFTTGSTGVPKGVEYSHEHFLAQVEILRGLYDIQPGDVSVSTFPPFALFGPLLGLTVVVPRMDPTKPARVDPRRVADAVNTCNATLMFGSPALLNTVARWGERTGQKMPTLRRVVTAGAPVAPDVQRRFLAMLGPDAEVHSPYGATEALPVTSIGSREVLALDEIGICVGRPVPGVDVALVEIVDEPLPSLDDDLRVPQGEIGEIVVRGPNVTWAYANRPAATASAKIDWDGRIGHRMGDVGYFDRLGRLWFCGRKVDRVTTAQGTLFTVPCESVFDTHPRVFRSALVGVGPRGRQRPVVCIELEHGVRATPALTRELLDLAVTNPATVNIRTVLYHRGFPVDIRHNAKISHGALAEWASKELM